MEQLLAWVKKLAVFMILCSYMEHLIPSHYKRYSDDQYTPASDRAW